MLVRYLLEKCKNTKEAIKHLKMLPIASQQVLIIADSYGDIASIECNNEKMHIVHPSKENDFVLSTNNFYSDELKQYNNLSIDDWKSNEDIKSHIPRSNKTKTSFLLIYPRTSSVVNIDLYFHIMLPFNPFLKTNTAL